MASYHVTYDKSQKDWKVLMASGSKEIHDSNLPYSIIYETNFSVSYLLRSQLNSIVTDQDFKIVN